MNETKDGITFKNIEKLVDSINEYINKNSLPIKCETCLVGRDSKDIECVSLSTLDESIIIHLEKYEDIDFAISFLLKRRIYNASKKL